jgi:hypothetical protein
LRHVRLELEEKLKLQDDTIRRKDRTIQLHVMHQTHLEQENLHLRELLNAEVSAILMPMLLVAMLRVCVRGLGI